MAAFPAVLAVGQEVYAGAGAKRQTGAALEHALALVAACSAARGRARLPACAAVGDVFPEIHAGGSACRLAGALLRADARHARCTGRTFLPACAAIFGVGRQIDAAAAAVRERSAARDAALCCGAGRCPAGRARTHGAAFAAVARVRVQREAGVPTRRIALVTPELARPPATGRHSVCCARARLAAGAAVRRVARERDAGAAASGRPTVAAK